MDIKGERRDAGSSLLELLLALTILLVFAGATVSLYTSNLKRYNAEQQTSEMNQAARNALELISLEIQQAGSHADVSTEVPLAVIGLNTAQTIGVTSSADLYPGDWVTIEPGTAREETFKITAVGSDTITGKITKTHLPNAPLHLFAQPYKSGIINALGPSATASKNHIKFFGDINGDGTLYYVEYTFSSSTGEILRSITPLNSNNKTAASPIAENVAGFDITLYSDSQGNVSKVRIQLTVNNTNSSPMNQVTMSDTIMVRSVAAASNLAIQAQQYGTPSRLPPTPAPVVSWSG